MRELCSYNPTTDILGALLPRRIADLPLDGRREREPAGRAPTCFCVGRLSSTNTVRRATKYKEHRADKHGVFVYFRKFL